MSRKAVKIRFHKPFVARCGAFGLAVCCVLGSGSEVGILNIHGRALFGQQQTEQNAQQNPVVFFSFPIGVNSAPILASPSNQTYQTGKISKDETVEIYFRNEDGYCAIRPPKGSFSWINGKFVLVESDSIGHVYSTSGKAVPARVGGPSPATSSVVQVGLKNNQKVKILDQQKLQDGSVWYKIAPPPGEFRWIHETSLAQSPALAQLPDRLTFQSEYLQRLKAPREKQETSGASHGLAAAPKPKTGLSEENVPELSLPLLDEEETFAPVIDANRQTSDSSRPNSLTAPQSASDAYDQSTFQSALESLRNDVGRTLQTGAASNSELSSLQARAEDLFDKAPNDEQRYNVQAIFEAIAKAQIRRQQAGAPSQQNLNNDQRVPNQPLMNATPNITPYPNGSSLGGQFPMGMTTNGQYPYAGQFVDQNGQIINPSFLNGQNVDGLQIVNGQIVGTPTMIDGQYVVGAEIVDDSANTEKSKSRLGFAFSNSNNPFRKSSRESSAASRSRGSRLESSFSHLPGVAQNQTTTIVPPQNYTQGTRSNASNSFANSRLTPGPLRAELAQKNKVPSGSALVANQNKSQTSKGTLIFQAPQLATNTIPANPGSGDTAPTSWKAVQKELSPADSSSIMPASSEQPQNNESKIRSTSAFAPIASQSFDNHDTTGVLIELSGVADGAPRYALLDKSDDAFNVVAYLDPGKNVSFEKFVGQKVVVKGSAGTVAVNGKTQKHIVVSSLFLQK